MVSKKKMLKEGNEWALRGFKAQAKQIEQEKGRSGARRGGAPTLMGLGVPNGQGPRV